MNQIIIFQSSDKIEMQNQVNAFLATKDSSAFVDLEYVSDSGLMTAIITYQTP